MAYLKLLKEDVIFPKRATINSAGHDVFTHEDITIKSREIKQIELPFEINFDEEKERVFIFLRSSIGIKKHCKFIDSFGEIAPLIKVDANKKIIINLKNNGNDDLTLEKGTHFCQIVITKSQNEEVDFLLEKVNNVPSGINIHPMSYKKGEQNQQTLFLDEELTIPKGEAVMLASGFKAKIPTNTFLGGFVPIPENRFVFSNGVAVGDADYYNNPDNEGMYFFKLENTTNVDITLEEGTAIVDLIAIEFFILENAQNEPTQLRQGGIGSTN